MHRISIMFRGSIRAFRALGVTLVLGAVAAPLSAAADMLATADAKQAKAAFKAMDKNDWRRVPRYEKRIKDPLAKKLIRWFRYTRPGTRASFPELARFVTENPDWPKPGRLLRRTEEAITFNSAPDAVLDWFAAHPPVSTEGKVRLGEALLKAGQIEKARVVLRDAWVNGSFGKGQEKNFYRRHRKLLTYGDNVERLDRLLWEGRNGPSRRMLWKVRGVHRLLGEARWLLRQRRGNVDKAIARIPKEARNDPGLVYERVRWRRRKGKTKSATELLLSWDGDMGEPTRWWTERSILARKALAGGHVTEAYRMVSAHGLRPGGAEYAEAEWLAGWIKLRFLRDKAEALQHFQKMFQAVRYPISRSRGAYWAGRAAEALGHQDWAYLWYRTAAHHPTTYYGQLAIARLAPGQKLALPPEPEPNPNEIAAFVGDELVRASRMLAELGQNDRLRPFIRELAEHGEDPGWKVLTAKLARRLGRVDLAISTAKRAGLDGRVYAEAGYPVPALPRIKARKARAAAKRVEEPLVLSMIRQESLFHDKAKSRAGARGLMQLMPKTAYRVSKRLGLKYSKRRLTENPAYNLTLGQAYLAEMLEEFNGSYVLAIAAYNAGPSRARAWVRANGDPRDDEVEVVDWVEMIPFSETRDYVQRVLENLQVYRHRLTEAETVVALESDLKRKESGK